MEGCTDVYRGEQRVLTEGGKERSVDGEMH